MKKIIAISLIGAMLGTFAACSSDKKDDTPTTTTTATTKPEIPGDTVLVNDGYDIDFTKYLEIPDLSALKVSLADIEQAWLSDADTIRYEYVEFTEAVEGDTVTINDKVNIHFKGYAADEETVLSESTLANMTNIDYDDEGVLAAGYDLILGSNSFIGAYESETHPEKNNQGFEEQLVGMKVGETRTITVTFPDNYGSAELNGTVIHFDVTVNSLHKGTLPELTDEMVATYTSNEYTTVEALKAEIYTYYKQHYAYSAVYNAFTVKDYPEDLIDSSIAEYVANYITATYGDEELTEEESKTIFDEQYDNALASAESIVGERLILEYLFDMCDITLIQSEYLEMRAEDFANNGYYYLYYYGISDEEALEEAFSKDYLVVQYKYEKLLPELIPLVTFE